MADEYKFLTAALLPSVAGIILAPSAGSPSGGSYVFKAPSGVQNNDTASRTFQLWINGTDDLHAVPSCGTANDPITLGRGESRVMSNADVIVLGPSDALYGVASVSGKLIFQATGDKVT